MHRARRFPRRKEVLQGRRLSVTYTPLFGNVTKPTKGGRPAPMNGHPLTLSGSLGFAILLSKIIQPYTTSARASSESINWHADGAAADDSKRVAAATSIVVVAAARH
jgi:hypothetical protein